jgi:hypothetical protein
LQKRKGERAGKIFGLCWRESWRPSELIHSYMAREGTDDRGEGLVVKKLDCTYSTNSRGADWVKVKPE